MDLKILYFKYRIMKDRDFVEFQEIKFFHHPYHKDYLASKCGNILSLKRKEKKILKLCLSGNNYLTFHFCENNKKRKYYIHRFVFETFKGEIPSDKQVDHLDNDKFNNQISNLQLLTQAENNRKSHCKKVISYNILTKEKKIFNSLLQAGEYYKISSRTVGHNCQKKIKTTKSKKDGKKYQFFYFKN